ncbi:MAG TPA: metallophosphoesterase, partial [Arenibacter sp.]|nr:metallophosphoesterase [Arenibacter sp.]
MKHRPIPVFFIIAALFLLRPVFGQQNYIPPKLSHPDSWSIILIPDTQSYVKFERNHGILETMTAWISENIDPLNIKMVLCTGDLVEQNELLVPDNINGNLPSRDQWRAVSHAFERLDGKVPYILAAGNHDFGYKSVENRRTNYSNYFPSHRNLLNEKGLREAGKNLDGFPSVENSAYEFISPQHRKFLFLNLE